MVRWYKEPGRQLVSEIETRNNYYTGEKTHLKNLNKKIPFFSS